MTTLLAQTRSRFTARRWWLVWLVGALVLALLAGGGALLVHARGATHPSAQPGAPAPGPGAGPGAGTGTREVGTGARVPMSPIGPYAQAVDVAARDRLRVWLEIDLVKRWEAGPAAFAAGVARIGELAKRPGVVGVKVADELGYNDGLRTSAQVQAFLDAARPAVARAAPGKLVLIDMILPELGCVPGGTPRPLWATVCSAHARGDYPQLQLSAVDGYLHSGDVDALDLSTGLLPDKTYAGWGLDRDDAQRAAWHEVERRGWPRLVGLQARKALAHPGDYQGSAATANRDIATWVDLPARLGATAVDIWTWSQGYKGGTYRLTDAGLRENPLWDAIVVRHERGVRLFTHFTPSSVQVSLIADLGALARGFTDVFIATGTG